MANYKMDFTTNTLTITKDFEKKAMNVNSVEYQTLKQLKADFPSLRIVRKASRQCDPFSVNSYQV